jgi:hypothetical protein
VHEKAILPQIRILFDVAASSAKAREKADWLPVQAVEENGRDYYALKERLLAKPADPLVFPSTENLAYHFEQFTELEGSWI